MNQYNAKLSPSDVMSLVIDGADQSAFGLPYFVTVTKDTKGHALKVKLVGVLEHGPDNRAALYTMTEYFETGANHVIEGIHRYLNRINARNGLPKTLFIQMDNCTREKRTSTHWATWRVSCHGLSSFKSRLPFFPWVTRTRTSTRCSAGLLPDSTLTPR